MDLNEIYIVVIRNGDDNRESVGGMYQAVSGQSLGVRNLRIT